MGFRPDAIGLFWEDEVKTPGKKGTIIRPMPEIPETGWTTPTCFPNLRFAQAIAVDVETWDPDLEDFGPGWARGVGHIVGVSIGTPDGGRWYFPMRHETEPETNMDPEHVLAWLRDTLKDPNQPKVGANLTYDIGWLAQEGVVVKGELIDVQFAEALLDEAAPVALDILGMKYLGLGKESGLMYQWLSDWFGGNPTGKQRKHIYKTPPRLCGPYAESDVDIPLRVAERMWPILAQEGLIDVFKMECALIPLSVAMRFEGVSVDVDAAEKLKETLTLQEVQFQKQLDDMAGFHVEVTIKDSLVRLFKQFGIPYRMTAPTAAFPNGQPSITKDQLEALDHPVGELIRSVKQCQHLRGTFVQSYILDAHINGKVYGQFHQLRGDSYGTRSGRYSASNPNLQNIPSRDPILAPLIRGLFIPDPGHLQWRKYDYSQIEYRCLIHDAVGVEGDKVRAMFNADPSIDYHNFIQNLIHHQTGIWIERKPIKSINFGLIYGMGVAALASSIGLTRKAGGALVKEYHKGVPFAAETMAHYTELASTTGVISTIMGRKSRFDTYESAKWGGDDRGALPYALAILKWGNIRRAYTHKALNRRLQGSAADMMKAAMLKCWQDGVFDVTGVPRLTVHDELDFSDPGGKDEAFLEMKHIMETALPLRIPIKADGEAGPDWGHVFEIAA